MLNVSGFPAPEASKLETFICKFWIIMASVGAYRRGSANEMANQIAFDHAITEQRRYIK